MQKLQTITIKEYLTKKDINYAETNGELITNCVFCGKEKHLYFNATTGQYNCWVCGEQGNIFTLAKHFGDTINDIALYPRTPIKKSSGTKFDPELVETCCSALPANIRQYLNARGITDAIIDAYKLGWGEFYGNGGLPYL
jgi:hypothetical protein